MRVNIVRSIAMVLSVCLSSVSYAQYGGYSSPGYGSYAQQPSAVPVHPSLQNSAPAGSPYFNPAQVQVAQAPGPQTAATPGYSYTYQPSSPYRTISQPNMGYQAVPGTVPMQQGYAQPGYGYSMPANAQPNTGYPMARTVSGGCSTCNQQPMVEYAQPAQPNIYIQAASAPCNEGCGMPCEPVCCEPCPPPPTPIRHCFAGANVLFLTRVDNYDRRLLLSDAMPSTTTGWASDADMNFALGYDVTIGSYLACGRYAVSATWLHIENNAGDATIVPSMPGEYRSTFRNWDRIYFDADGNNMHSWVGAPSTDESMYAYFDRAAGYRIQRDASYYGVELNLTGFGIGGAARAGRPCGGAGGCGNSCNSCNPCNPCGDCNSCCYPKPGCGGICGPMIPSCNCRLQMSWSTGPRWFHFDESFLFGARAVRYPGDPAATMPPAMADFAYTVDTDNDLFGWQWGGQAAYCLGCRTSIYGGAKAGLYANNASVRSRIGSTNMPALVSDNAINPYPSTANMPVEFNDSDTVLSTMGELDFGIGYRICKCWTIRGGYRMLGVTNVATTLGNITDDPAILSQNKVWANDSLLLHGGYVGVNYNW